MILSAWLIMTIMVGYISAHGDENEKHGPKCHHYPEELDFDEYQALGIVHVPCQASANEDDWSDCDVSEYVCGRCTSNFTFCGEHNDAKIGYSITVDPTCLPAGGSLRCQLAWHNDPEHTYNFEPVPIVGVNENPLPGHEADPYTKSGGAYIFKEHFIVVNLPWMCHCIDPGVRCTHEPPLEAGQTSCPYKFVLQEFEENTAQIRIGACK